MELKNKIILITGASSGIGEACARHFAKAGAKLIICARREQRLTTLASELEKQYNTAIHTLTLDVCNRQAVKQAIASLPTPWQAIEILINNAGLAAGLAPLANGDIDDWEQMIDTNIKGLLYLTRAILPGMIERNQGHIVNIGSISSHEVYPQGAVYCATKHAVSALTKGLKMDLTGTPIRVTSIDPGMVETEFSHVRFRGDEEKAKQVYAGLTPLTSDDIAESILFCITRPAHVNISEIILLPVAQSSVSLVHRD